MLCQVDQKLVLKSMADLNKKLVKVQVLLNKKHVFERLVDRDIHIVSFREAIYGLIIKKLCLFTYLTYLSNEIRPMSLEIRTNDVILIFGRVDDNVWRLNTVLDPKIHNKYDDEKPKLWQQTIKV